jgi:hypothetical protein
MPLKLKDATYYLPLSIPIAYFGMLFIYASAYYASYYGGLTQVPFDFYSLLVGSILSVTALGIVYMITAQDRQTLQRSLEEAKKQLVRERQNHRNLVAKFLVTQDLTSLFTSNLFEDLQKGGGIEEENKVKKLTGGYSGAQVYLFYRKESRVPYILKVDDLEEINNEYQKFTEHVRKEDGRVILPLGPSECREYLWGDYGGLGNSFARDDLKSEYLTFMEIYKACLDEQARSRVDIGTIERIIKERLFIELAAAWGWTEVGLDFLNIYEQYFPFTRKFAEIRQFVLKIQTTQSNSDLNTTGWPAYWEALNDFLSENKWRVKRADNEHYVRRMAMAVIHGDLNSRNILVGVNPDNYNDIRTIKLVDFSHTGIGLTGKRTNEFIKGDIKLFYRWKRDEQGNERKIYLAHLANDFCRLEADIKFYLTDLNNERDLRQAWILECLLLKHGLNLPTWKKLQDDQEFGTILQAQGLVNEPKWEELSHADCWTEDSAGKFVLIWQSVKAIRSSLLTILRGQPRSMQPFYMALLQASLSMIYYEDERFHNANLQKLYIVLASGMLCEKLLGDDKVQH